LAYPTHVIKMPSTRVSGKGQNTPRLFAMPESDSDSRKPTILPKKIQTRDVKHNGD
jgi:hypothetical protein